LRRKLLAVLVVAAAALAAASVAYADNFDGFAPGDPHSPPASEIQTLYWYIFAFAGAVFLLVQGALILFTIRYRRRRRAETDEGPQIHGSHRLEWAWTTAPVLILLAILGFIFVKLPSLKGVPPANAGTSHLEVHVEGHRFYWEYKYPNGVVTVERMVVPVGTVVRLSVTAPVDDVIHSWWIPDLNGKTDAIPGHPNHSWFKATKPGVYVGQCAELCGIQHTAMTAEVQAMPPAEFQRWYGTELQAQRSGKSDLGKMTFQGVCAKCHGGNAQGDIGPKLAGNPLLNDRKGLESIVRNGRATMPDVGHDWSDRQMTALYDYVHSKYGSGSKTLVQSPAQSSSVNKGGSEGGR
jgi:cytochrome c oxidase subunit 2